MSDKLETLRESLKQTNEHLSLLGLPEIEAIAPADCLGAAMNARYMTPEQMQNLAANIAKDKRLETMPLVHRDEKKPGKFRIISGHHRIEAAKKAGLTIILVMVIAVASEAEATAKQLSHNSIVGRDDEVILAKLFASLSSIDDKYYSGLQDTIASINPVALNFRAGVMAELSMAFMPEDIERVDNLTERITLEIKASGSAPAVRLASMESFTRWTDLLKKVKKLENVKNNAAAFMRVIEMAEERFVDVKAAKDAASKPQPPVTHAEGNIEE